MEKVDVSQLARLLADPQKWLDSGEADDIDLEREEGQTLFLLAQFLVKERNEAKEREFAAWCNEFNLNKSSNEARYLYFELLPLVQFQRDLIHEHEELHQEMAAQVEQLRRTLRAVEETQQLMSDRVNCVYEQSMKS